MREPLRSFLLIGCALLVNKRRPYGFTKHAMSPLQRESFTLEPPCGISHAGRARGIVQQPGQCVCGAGLSYCQNGGCVNLATSKNHCGSCQNQCDNNQQCVNGNCQGG